MRRIILLYLAITVIGCSREAETTGVTYIGKANLNVKLHQFNAVSEEGKSIVLTMTAARELTYNIGNKVGHINYESEEIVVRPEGDAPAWTVNKTKDGFELEDGSVLEFGNCKGWTMCLLDSETKEPVLKGKYLLSGERVNITLWISENERHAELLGLMTNALFNKSRNAHQSIQSALETLSAQVWTY